MVNMSIWKTFEKVDDIVVVVLGKASLLACVLSIQIF